jgi:hypothetical protein
MRKESKGESPKPPKESEMSWETGWSWPGVRQFVGLLGQVPGLEVEVEEIQVSTKSEPDYRVETDESGEEIPVMGSIEVPVMGVRVKVRTPGHDWIVIEEYLKDHKLYDEGDGELYTVGLRQVAMT